MAIGFRKSLFGFNSDDVISYIERTHKSYAEKEAVLKVKIKELDNSLATANDELEAIKQAKEKIEEELKVYTDKYVEIERLSQNIGKLYLVAQANANSIMQASQESSELSRKEVVRNLTSIEDAHGSLNELKTEILRTSAGFAAKVEVLMSELEATREKINQNISTISENTAVYDAVYNEVSK